MKNWSKLVGGLLLILFTALVVGLCSFKVLITVWAMILPPLFYIFLTKSMQHGKVYKRCCVSLSVAGLLVASSVTVGGRLTLVLLILAALLILFAAVTMFVKIRKWVAPVLVATLLPGVILPLTIGMNPYAVTDGGSSSPLPVYQGVFIVKKPEYNDYGNQIYKYGLRDRLGLIVPMEYSDIKVMDPDGRFVLLVSENYPNGQRIGVYDLEKKKFVVNPAYETSYVIDVEQINSSDFRLFNSDGRYFATLRLPGGYSEDARIVPYFSDSEVSVVEFLGMAHTAETEPFNETDEKLLDSIPHAYKLYRQMINMGTEACSPQSDIHFSRALEMIIEENPHYRGNIAKALDDVTRIGDMISEIEYGDESESSAIRLLCTSAKLSLASDSLYLVSPYFLPVKEEYVAWHNLTEAMTRYLDYMYTFPIVESDSVASRNNQVIKWLDHRLQSTLTGGEIIAGKRGYTVPQGKSFHTEADYDSLFYGFHSDDFPDYYNPMWNEVRYAFYNLIEVREQLAAELESDKARAYEAHSQEVIDSLFIFIEDLDLPGFRPAL
ncbi:MAG: hypothetical protein K2O00_04565 [Muribaculaceae bacterium]|nr:hypothetical protein [Muribaculaceae bacterium]